MIQITQTNTVSGPMPFVNHFHLTYNALNFWLETSAADVNENIPRLNMSICASHARPQSNVRREVALARAISKETTDQQSSAARARARSLNQKKKREKRGKRNYGTPEISSIAFNQSHRSSSLCSMASKKKKPPSHQHLSFLVDKSARGMHIYIYTRAHTHTHHHTGILSSS